MNVFVYARFSQHSCAMSDKFQIVWPTHELPFETITVARKRKNTSNHVYTVKKYSETFL